MHPTSLASSFQTKRNDAIRSVTLAELYLETLQELYGRYLARKVPHAEAYRQAGVFLWRIRNRLGDACTPEQCSFTELSLWEMRQRAWREFEQHTYELSLLPNLPENVIESCRKQHARLDDPNRQ